MPTLSFARLGLRVVLLAGFDGFAGACTGDSDAPIAPVGDTGSDAARSRDVGHGAEVPDGARTDAGPARDGSAADQGRHADLSDVLPVDAGPQSCTAAEDCPEPLGCVQGVSAPCSGAGECRAARGEACLDGICGPCAAATDCLEGEGCRLATGACGPCRVASECPAGQSCRDGVCAPCSAGPDCHGGLCVEGVCRDCTPEEDDAACAEQYGDAEVRCRQRGICEPDTCSGGLDCWLLGRVCSPEGRCVDCGDTRSCLAAESGGYAAGTVCVEGVCLEGDCREHVDCTQDRPVCGEDSRCRGCQDHGECLERDGVERDRICEPLTGRCLAGDCYPAAGPCGEAGERVCGEGYRCADCDADAQCRLTLASAVAVCAGGACALGCRDATGCGGDMVCGPDSRCRGCVGDAECTAGYGAGHLCVGERCVVGECRGDGDCDGGQRLCERNRCRACEAHWECGDGRLCDDGVCLQGECVADADCVDLEAACVVGSCQENRCVANPRADGRPCTDDDLCTFDDRCQGGHCAGTTIEPAGCADGLDCTEDRCTGTAECQHELQLGRCAVGGRCFAVGELNPDAECQLCDPLADPLRFSPRTGLCAGDTRVCHAGECRPCLLHADCGLGRVCDGGSCFEGECATHAECQGQLCAAHVCVDCAADAECRDALGPGTICEGDDFGRQVCLAGNCHGHDDCLELGKVCDRGTHLCSLCAHDAACVAAHGEGLICEGSLCIEGNCRRDFECFESAGVCQDYTCGGCVDDIECKGAYANPNYLCDPAGPGDDQATCVRGCSPGQRCVGGQVCGDDNRCAPCADDGACQGAFSAGYLCLEGACLPADCRSSVDCDLGQRVCDANRCRDCEGSPECGAERICGDGRCRAGDCFPAAAACGAQVDRVCGDNLRCRDCRTDGECRVAMGSGGAVCEQGVCRLGCAGAEPCDPGEVCGPDHRCQGCLDDAACAIAYSDAYLCIGELCQQADCRSNDDCDRGQRICDALRCRDCVRHDECAVDQVCDAGRCIAGDCSPPGTACGFDDEGVCGDDRRCGECIDDAGCRQSLQSDDAVCDGGGCALGCVDTADCDAGLICGGDRRCRACTGDPECSVALGDGYLCVEERCIPADCRAGDECDGGQRICDRHQCRACVDHAECGPERVCADDICLSGDCYPALAACGEQGQQVCSDELRCGPCVADGGCRASLQSDTAICTDGACALGCASALGCQGGQLCGDDHRCVACGDDAGCGAAFGAGHLCIEGACVAADCRTNADCDEGQRICGPEHRCRACERHAECGAGKVCDDGVCLQGECVEHADCDALDGPCQDGVCEQHDCVRRDKPEHTDCNDDDLCTYDDQCSAGVCLGLPAAPAGCDDELECTVDACTGTAACVNTLQPGACVVDEQCWAQGVVNPARPCQICDPRQHDDEWSPREGLCADGARVCRAGDCVACAGHADCGDGRVCDDGTCHDGDCVRSDVCPSGLCWEHVCVPCQSGVRPCADGQVCDAGVCHLGDCVEAFDLQRHDPVEPL